MLVVSWLRLNTWIGVFPIHEIKKRGFAALISERVVETSERPILEEHNKAGISDHSPIKLVVWLVKLLII